MLTITVSGDEFFDEENEQFVNPESFTLELEHSLVSLSKWESKHEKPFLSSTSKTNEELASYIHLMILTPDIGPEVINQFSTENVQQINDYLDAKMTATWFQETPNAPKSSETITAELIYYWMTVFTIPMECEKWHLNRLFTLLKVCNLKNAKPKKMGRGEQAARNRELNAQRRAQLGTTG